MRNIAQWPAMALGVISRDPGTVYDYEKDPFTEKDPWQDEKEPWQEIDVPVIIDVRGGLDTDQIKGTTYYGIVRDAQTEKPVPSATVMLYNGDAKVTAAATNANGEFSFNTSSPVTSIIISSVGYKPWEWPASEYQHTFDLERDLKELPPVIVTTTPGTKKKNNLLLWVVGGFILYKASQDGI